MPEHKSFAETSIQREAMRVNPPVQHTERMCNVKEDVIPLQTPVKGKNGQMIDAIRIKKGQHLHIAILPYNHSKEIFGQDASVFRPERWLEEDLTSKVRGFAAWSPILSFLGGPRCVLHHCVAVLLCSHVTWDVEVA